MFQESVLLGELTHPTASLDPIQVTQMAKYLETVYVSGWQSSSTASSTHEPGPDLAGTSICIPTFAKSTDKLPDYPSNTVPNKVEHLFQAQLFHDRKQREARSRMADC